MLAIAILSSLYTVAQVLRQVQELSTGKELIKPRLAAMIDFFGDQVCHSFFYDLHIDFYAVIFSFEYEYDSLASERVMNQTD